MQDFHGFFQYINLLKQIPIFSQLNWFDLQKIARKVEISEHKKGDIISAQGGKPDYLYCLVSGRLQAYMSSGDGVKRNIEFVHRGTHFGIISVLTGETHTRTFEALNDSVILRIPKDDFQDILKAIPHLGVELSQTLSRRIHKTRQGKSVFESSIISVYSPVKGTGCSAYSINLAISLAQETKKKVIYVNIHPRAQEGKSSRTRKDSLQWKAPSVYLSDIVDDHEKIHANIIKGDLGIDLINVNFDHDRPAVSSQISPFVSALVGDYHYVVVDLPNEMGEVVLEALTQSDVVHLLTYDRKDNLSMIRKVIDELELSLKDRFREEKIRVIIRASEDRVYLSFEEINRFIDYHVYTMLPFVSKDELRVERSSEFITFIRPDEKLEYSKTIRHIARAIGEVLVGVAFGGGAALGLAHIGVIRVLEEENIPVDVIVGSSMGALVGGLWAIGKKTDEIEKIASEFQYKRNMLKLFDPVFPVSGLIGGRLIKRWLRKHFGSQTFYGCKIPFKVVTYDLSRREEVILDGGSLVDAVRQSISIPGVLEPVRKRGQILIDGGVLNPLPTNVLRALGIKKIIAVNVLSSPQQVSSGLDIENKAIQHKLNRPFYRNPFKYFGVRMGLGLKKIFMPNISDIIVNTLQASEYVLAEQSAQQADVTIHPDLIGINWFELDKYEKLIRRGIEAARKNLPKIKQLIEE